MKEPKDTGFQKIASKLPGWILTFIGFITAINGFINLINGNSSRGIILISSAGIVGLSYFLFSVIVSKTEKVKVDIKNAAKYIAWEPKFGYYQRVSAAIGILVIAFGMLYLFFNEDTRIQIYNSLSSAAYEFRTAAPDELLIIVAKFDNRSEGNLGIDPTERIYNEIRNRLSETNMTIRLERLNKSIVDKEEARSIISKYNAAIVIWGWFDEIGAQPGIEINQEKVDYQPNDLPESTYSTQESVLITFTKELPAQASYVALFTLGLMEYRLDSCRSATDLFTEAINSASLSQGKIRVAAALDYRGLCYGMLGEAELAEADLTQAIALEPTSEMAYINRAVNSEKNKKDYDAALKDYDIVLGINPNNKIAYHNRGIVYWILNNYESALADFNKAIELDDTFIPAYWRRFDIYYYELENPEGAIETLLKLEKLDPNLYRIYVLLGGEYMKLKQWDNAIESFEKADKILPGTFTMCSIGAIYTMKGDFETAISYMKRALDMDPHGTQTWCKEALDNANRRIPTDLINSK